MLDGLDDGRRAGALGAQGHGHRHQTAVGVVYDSGT
jgi:hypothetical protein